MSDGTVVAASSLALGARIAQEGLGAPLATIEVCPFSLRSEHDSPQFASWLPSGLKRLLYGVQDAVIDRLLGADVNAFRAELGLPPVRRLFDRWWKSPQRVIGLFPGWFAFPQPDWPPQVRTTGFPLYDQQGAVEVPQEATSFIEQGSLDILQPEVMWVGGLTETLRIAAHASAHDLPVVPHGSGPYSYHFIASQTGPAFCEYVAASPDGRTIMPVFGDLFEGEEMPENGRLKLSDAPGFGMTLADRASLEIVP